MAEENDGFLSRWSKRKQAIAAGEDVRDHHPDHPVVEQPDAEAEAARLALLEENRLTAEAIDITALTSESDFTPFMKEGVPQLLKQRAMRVLFRSNPVFANLDGLCDYDENFADPSLILKTFDSAYKIGKGYLTDDDEDETEAADEALAHADEEGNEGKTEEVAQSGDVKSDEANDNNAEEVPTQVAEAPATTPEPSVVEYEEAAIEQSPMPRVSLRDRLRLDA